MHLRFALCLAVLSACSRASGPVSSESPTYYRDVQPIVQAKCAGCHTADGLGPFELTTANDVISHKALIAGAVASKTMPPWPPDSSCNTYQRDRSLSDTEISTLLSWVDAGAPEGDPATAVTGTPAVGMSRVDMTLAMPGSWTPTESPDQYRCFLIPWTPTTPQYVTGLGVKPGDAQIVHHAIAYIATPNQISQYQALDDADPGLGWTCFGGPGLNANVQWLGAWAPGALGTDFPTGTGILVQPGSMIVLQVHYNTANTPPAPDLTTVAVELASSVGTPAAVVPFTNPAWVRGGMQIDAGDPDVVYSYGLDITPYVSLLTNGIIPAGPVTIYSSALHMHTRGTTISTSILHADGGSDCLLNIPSWNFSWQGQYALEQPVQMVAGDQLYLECHWDNTAAHQPYVNGVQLPPTTVNWGETTEDEMCLDILYLTR